MTQARLVLILLTAGTGAAMAQAPTRGTYVARLGTDTVAIERFALTDSSLTGVVLSRLGMTTRTDYRFRLRPNGSAEWAEWVERPVHGSVDTTTARFESDSSRVVRRSGAVVTYHAGRPLPLGFPDLPWGAHLEMAARRLGPNPGDSAHWDFVSQVPNTGFDGWITAWQFVRGAGDTIHIHRPGVPAQEYGILDRSGRPVRWRILRSQMTVTRGDDSPVDSVMARFLLQDRANGGLGTLSPRDTTRLSHRGTDVLVDYGRPSRRGRQILGGVVGYGGIWRTGANLATHFQVSRPIRLGGTRLPAGQYTLWTLPTPEGWTLIVNGETGQWGLNYNPARDVFRVPMRQETMAEPQERFTIRLVPRGRGAELRLEWDTWSAVLDLTFEPDQP